MHRLYRRAALYAKLRRARVAYRVAIPVLADNTETSGAGGDLVRHRRRLRVRIPSEIYADANPMVRHVKHAGSERVGCDPSGDFQFKVTENGNRRVRQMIGEIGDSDA